MCTARGPPPTLRDRRAVHGIRTDDAAFDKVPKRESRFAVHVANRKVTIDNANTIATIESNGLIHDLIHLTRSALLLE